MTDLTVIKIAVIFIIVMIVTVALSGLVSARSSLETLPPSISMIPLDGDECPCEFRLDSAPEGLSGFEFQFQARPARLRAIPKGWNFKAGLEVSLTGLWQHTTYAYAMVDIMKEIEPGATDILLFTFNSPDEPIVTSIWIDDDNGDRLLTWP